jgi:MinD-like ATPase involved in chromosome partitioning or flagellar assembly
MIERVPVVSAEADLVPGGSAAKSSLDPRLTPARGSTEIMKSCSVALRLMGDGELTSLAVTSTLRKEGRTTIAIGLTAAAVMERRRTAVLVDLDVERGSIEGRMSIPPGPSLLDLLEGTAPLDDCLVPVDQMVRVVRAGPHRDPISLVAHQDRLESLLLELRSRCDILVADLPPLGAGISTAHLADLFQRVALVVRAGATPVPLIDHLASTLTQQPFVMLNRTESRHRSLLRRRIRRS